MIQLNQRDPRPIYEQVKENFKNLIFQGVIRPDEKMPSVRDLAQKLSINPNTIQRAYRELEQEEMIYSIPGKGSFAASVHMIRDNEIRDLMHTFTQTADRLLGIGVSKEELIRKIEERSKL